MKAQEKKLFVIWSPLKLRTQEKLIINLESAKLVKHKKAYYKYRTTEISEIQEKLIVNNNWTDICLKRKV